MKIFQQALQKSLVAARSRHRWVMAIIIMFVAVPFLGRAPAQGASITQIEAALITAHGGAVTLQQCMTLWEAATHMSKVEWKAACKRTIVLEAPDNAH
jgi:hypothetical protein